MINMFKQFFAFITKLITGMDKFANVFVRVAEAAERGTDNWAEEISIEQEARLKELRATAAKRAKQELGTTTTTRKPRKKTTLKAAA